MIERKTLGRTGIEVSDLCLGSMTWGTQNSEAEGHAQIDRALERGVNFIDTAETYPATPPGRATAGRTEEIIGTWVAKGRRRDEVVLATKVSGEGSMVARDGDPISSSIIREALDGSLNRLQTDYVDLYQLHWPNRGSYHFRKMWAFDPSAVDFERDRDELRAILDCLGEEVTAGRIRAVGVSNDSAWGMMTMLRLADELGLPRIATVQNEYSLMCRHFDTDLAEMCLAEDVGLFCYSPLAAGLLTGKYRDGAMPEGSRRAVSSDSLGGRWTDRAQAAVEAYSVVAQRHGLSLTQMAIAWARSRPFMASVIIGATSVAQLDEVLDAGDITLPPECLADIDAAHRDHTLPF